MSSLYGSLWFQVSHEIIKVKMLAQGSHLRAGLGLESLPQDVPLQAGSLTCLARAGMVKRPQFLTMWTFPQSYLSVLTTLRLAVPRASRREQGGSGSVAMSPWLRSVGGDYMRAQSRRGGSAGPSWRLHTIPFSREEPTAAPVAGLRKPGW